jgi:hypothetical protein
VITGGSSGLGAEFARCAAADGHDLILVARQQERLEAVAAPLREAYGVKVTCRPLDLCDRGALEAFCEELRAGNVVVDAFVNNAGFALMGAFSDADPRRVAALVDVNIGAMSLLLRAVLPGMVARRKGKVLNVASLAAYQPGPGAAEYFASKAYVKSLSEAVAHEVRGTGVKVLTLCPGPVNTPFARSSGLASTWLYSGLLGLETPARVANLAWKRVEHGSSTLVPGYIPKTLAVLSTVIPDFIRLRLTRFSTTEKGAGDPAIATQRCS